MATIKVLALKQGVSIPHVVGTYRFKEDLSEGVLEYTRSSKFKEGYITIIFKDEYSNIRTTGDAYGHLLEKPEPALA